MAVLESHGADKNGINKQNESLQCEGLQPTRSTAEEQLEALAIAGSPRYHP